MLNMFSYGKVTESDQAKLEACRRTRKRIAIIAVSSVVLICIVVGAVLGTANHNGRKAYEGGQVDSISTSVRTVCDFTLYKDTCFNSLRPVANSTNLQPEDLFKLSIQVALNELSKASEYFSEGGDLYNGVKDKMSIAALKTCGELLDLAVDHLNESIASAHGNLTVLQATEDLRTWLSSAGTYQETCIDALDETTNGELKTLVQSHLKNSTEMTSNCLAVITWLSKLADSIKLRRLMSTGDSTELNDDNKRVLSWVSAIDRRLMESPDLRTKAHIVVAKDGTGKYKTISRALEDVPEKSKKRTIIYVKKGVYVENVKVEKKKWNIVMVGDGMQSTIVSERRNFVDGTSTFKTATFAVFGKGFIARDMGFRNTAGPEKHQAVALMASADHTVFYRCHVDAFQDSLYAHAQRQFYRDCTVIGTVDFIFGNSAVVLQNCHIRPRRPMRGQKNTITAQGRFDPNQNTGISIQNATVSPFGDLTGVQTFLGRPWKNFSTTVFMKSFLGGLIDPKGWLPWTGDSAPDTIFYAEYENFGSGSSTKNRVKWKGLRFIKEKQAKKFTVKSFIDGEKWIPETGVKFKSGL